MTIPQQYFEMRDVRPFRGRPWIPLRQHAVVNRADVAEGDLHYEEYIGVATAAVPESKRVDVDKLSWSDLDLSAHRAGNEEWGYRSADVFRAWMEEPLGMNLVIDQHLEEPNCNVWHLHPDLIVALHLLREGDRWYRPEEGWVEVVRIKRDENDQPILLEIKTEFLFDYLEARQMSLYCSSYQERICVTAVKPPYTWSDDMWQEESGRDRREAIIDDAGYPHPDGTFWTRGCLWRTEWVDPGSTSVRVRGDKDPYTASFVMENDGSRATGDRLSGAMSWLYFSPTVVATLLRHRGGTLTWYTQETGGLGATSTVVHFGLNPLGLITVYAKDIGQLPAWEQRLWSAHNVTPDGGVSRELFAAQMNVEPAATSAPEKELQGALEALSAAFIARYSQPLLREHESLSKLLQRSHRFKAAESDGLLELAKNLTRLFTERIDVDAIVAQLSLAKGTSKPGSLKALEMLIATLRPLGEAQTMMAPLFGIYDLRLADAHIGSSRILSGKQRAGVDDTATPTTQGRELLQSFVDTLRRITAVLA